MKRSFVRSVRRLIAAFCAVALFGSTAGAQFYVNGAPQTTLPSAITYADTLTNPTIAWASGNAANQNISLSGAQVVTGGIVMDATSAGAPVAINGGTLYLNGSVTFNMTDTMGISSVIADGSSFTGSDNAGALVKGGSGTLYLSGSNTYGGGTVVNGGALGVTSNSNLGDTSGGVTLNTGTLQTDAGITTSRTITLNTVGTIDAYGSNSLFEGLITGTGQLAVTDTSTGGGGIITLTDTSNNYSGGTLLQKGGTLSIAGDDELGTGGLTFAGGTLQFQGTMSDSRSIFLNGTGMAGAGIFDTAGATTTLSGVINGGGTLVKASSGTLILSGANTYSGGTAIKGGVVEIYNEGNLGTGGLQLNGGTLLTLNAVTDYRSVALGPGGTINTDGNNDSFYGVFSDSFTGAGGSLTKTGAGTLKLFGQNTYTGGTTVSQGTLQMGANNVMPSGGALAIASGAAFDMNNYSLAPTFSAPAYALGDVINNGTLNVGSGQLALGGTYSGSGTLALALAPGVTNVTGNSMTLTGGTLKIASVNDPGMKTGDQFTAVSATTLNSSQFASVLSPAAVDFTASYTSTDVVLTAHLIAFASLAATPNQAAVAGGLEALRSQAQANPSGAAGAIMSALYTLDTPQIQTAFDQIGPIAYAGMSAVGFSGSNVQAEELGRRMTALDTGGKTGGVTFNTGNGTSVDMSRLFAEGGTDDQDPFGRHFESQKSVMDSGYGFYGSLVGTTGHQQSMNGSAGFEPGFGYRSGGVIVGGDYRVSDAVAVGLAGGYLSSRANVYTDAGSALNDGAGRAGVYAAIHEGAFRADLYAGGALDYFSTNRGILVGGNPSQNAVAHPKGEELNANGYFTYDVPTRGFGILAPFLGINEDRLMVHSFSEGGAGAWNLDVGAQTAQSLRSSLGIRQSTKSSASGGSFDTHWSLGWVHEFSDQSRAIDAQLAAGGGSFSVRTASLPADGALVGAGLVVTVDRETSFNFDYSLDIRDRFAENTLQAALHFLF